MITVIDSISHRESPFDPINWYMILEENDNYFFDISQTNEYDPIYFENRQTKIRPITISDIDTYLCIYYEEKNKMEQRTYNKITSIKKQLLRDQKISNVIGE
jgi:hypothetical protein